MTREEFIKVLEGKGYPYFESIGGNIILKGNGDIILNSITSLPSGIIFRNSGKVELDSLTNISPGVEFQNRWFTSLNSIKSIPPGVVFDNNGDVYLNSLVKGTYLNSWAGNIGGINYKRLINKMISLGLFDRG
jgi:hypothetical protein